MNTELLIAESRQPNTQYLIPNTTCVYQSTVENT